MSVTTELIPAECEQDPAIPDVPIYRLSVAQYHAMAKAGILGEDDPVELLEGWLVQKMTKHRPHSLSTLLIREALRSLISSGWYVDTQEPVTTEDSEPEPDIVVVRGSPRDYADRQPAPADVSLVIEVADSTLQTDRGRKLRLYARVGIAIYWIVNLTERQIEVYSDPSGPAPAPSYRECRIYVAGDPLPVWLDAMEIGVLMVADLLP